MATKLKYTVEDGKVYGRLTAIKSVCVEKYPSRRFHLCKCECGNFVTVRDSFLCKGVTKSCGCLWNDTLNEYQKENSKSSALPIGYRSGHLEIIEDLGVIDLRNKKEHCYKCKCDCGKEVTVRQYSLKHNQQSCGCTKQETVTKARQQKMRERRVFPEYLTSLLFYEEEKLGILEKRYTYEDTLHFKCSKCGAIFEKKISYIMRLNKEKESPISLCLECSNHRSSFEQEVCNYIKSIDPTLYFETNVWGVIRDDHKIYEADIYIPSKCIAIECNGDYFHSEQRDKKENYHQDKFNLAEKNGIHLIQIFQSMWCFNGDRIRNYLKDLLCGTRKVFARKCVIIEPSKEIVKSFYNTNHLQGYTGSSNINFALLYNQEIVAMMSFCKTGLHNPKKREEGYYELARYAVKSGFTVIGGPSKLLSYFENLYHPTKILSYSDNNFFTGSMYEKLGFHIDGKTRPRYHWYMRDQTVRTREQCQLKHLSKEYPDLYQQAITNDSIKNKETFIMESLQAVKVWHAGTKRWIKRYK